VKGFILLIIFKKNPSIVSFFWITQQQHSEFYKILNDPHHVMMSQMLNVKEWG
jgi:hypothetical protein